MVRTHAIVQKALDVPKASRSWSLSESDSGGALARSESRLASVGAKNTSKEVNMSMWRRKARVTQVAYKASSSAGDSTQMSIEML